jgi:hypothetical protein
MHHETHKDSKKLKKDVDPKVLSVFTKIMQQKYAISSFSLNSYSLEDSKRNHVFSFKKLDSSLKIAVKIYSISESQTAYSNETSIYKKLSHNQFRLNDYCFTPKLIESGEFEDFGYLILEYIDGQNLMDFITHAVSEAPMNNDSWRNLFELILSWLGSFYDMFQFLPSDIHIRNFIIINEKPPRLYGVDFEDSFYQETRELALIIGAVKVYSSILGAYPGIFESRYLDYKIILGQIWMDILSQSLKNKNDSTKKAFIDGLKKEGLETIQRRLRLRHESKDDAHVAEKNLNFVVKRLIDYIIKP